MSNMQLFTNPAKQIASTWAREMLSLPPGHALILDTETCDLHGEIIELAIINTDGHALYNRRFNPLTVIEPGAQRVHGISLAMLRGEPCFADEYPAIRAILEAASIVLIYNDTFDRGCLDMTYRLHGLEAINFPSACIMRWYAQWYGERGRGGYKWQKLSGGDHSALGDARAALALLRKMAGEVEAI